MNKVQPLKLLDYIKTNDKNYKVWLEVIALHLSIGSSEGYGSVARKAKMLMKVS
jgi:hypothetical protein